MRETPEVYEEEVFLPADHWLYKMDGYLDWRVVGPQINNPYEIAFPDRVLDAMVKYRDVVRSHIKVRCLCDGHEVLRIDNLAMPILYTDHPCLVGTQRRVVIGFLTFFGIEDEIERTIDRVQEEVREELNKREQQRVANKEHKSLAQIKAEREQSLRVPGGKSRAGGAAGAGGGGAAGGIGAGSGGAAGSGEGMSVRVIRR